MKITSKGQVTIPAAFRERLGFLPNTEVEFDVQDNVLVLKKAEGGYDRGRRIVSRIKGKATAGMSTEEIMALTRDN